MFTLRLARHGVRPDVFIFEIWNGSTLMGVIYPTERGIKVVSKYLIDDPEGAIKIERDTQIPIPAILINLIAAEAVGEEK